VGWGRREIRTINPLNAFWALSMLVWSTFPSAIIVVAFSPCIAFCVRLSMKFLKSAFGTGIQLNSRLAGPINVVCSVRANVRTSTK